MRRLMWVLMAILAAAPGVWAQGTDPLGTGTTDSIVVEVTLATEPVITEELLLRASETSGYGRSLPKQNLEAMAVIYDVAYELAGAHPTSSVKIITDRFTGRMSVNITEDGVSDLAHNGKNLKDRDMSVTRTGAHSFHEIATARASLTPAGAHSFHEIMTARASLTPAGAHSFHEIMTARAQFDTALMAGQLAKLTIQPEKGDKVEVMFNPREYTISPPAALLARGAGPHYTLFLPDATPVRARVSTLPEDLSSTTSAKFKDMKDSVIQNIGR